MNTCRVALAATTACLLLSDRPVHAQDRVAQAKTAFQNDVHAGAGLTCISCHTAGASRISVPEFAAPKRKDIAPLCGKCHSDAAYMRPFAPQMRVDQLAQYVTSVHGTRMAAGEDRVATCSDCHGAHGVVRVSDTRSPVAGVCAQCHVREAELFRGSPKKALFEAIGQPGCLTCHSNHRIEAPADAWIGLSKEAVCATCHDESTPGSKTIVEVRQGLDGLTTHIAAAQNVLARAERAGMLVDEGSAALREAREHLIHSRVMVHAFASTPFTETMSPGLLAAQHAEQFGVRALRELAVRRRGLGVATVFIVGFLVSLWLKIRRLPVSQ